MDIKRINEEFEQLFEGDIEWVYEPICQIEPLDKDVLNEQLCELLNKNVNMYGMLPLKEAVTTMAELYHEGKLNVAIPTDVKFIYKGLPHNLHLVMGSCAKTNKQIECKYGVKHILDKHSKENVTYIDTQSITKEQTLLNAMKNVDKAIENGAAFIDKYNNDRLALLYNGLLYIICFDTKENELTYLHTLFRPSKNYKNRNLKYYYDKTENPKITKESD